MRHVIREAYGDSPWARRNWRLGALALDPAVANAAGLLVTCAIM
jgi:hypothetical protein